MIEHDPVSRDGLERLLASAVLHTRESVVITRAELEPPGPEIVFVNDAFCQLTGYARHEVVGTNPRFLQGIDTDRRVIARLRRQLAAGERFEGETFNYRKDGSPFVMSWRIDPLFDGAGRITHYVAVQADLTRLRTLEQRVRANDDLLSVLHDVAHQAHDTRAAARVMASVTELVASILRADAVCFAARYVDELDGQQEHVVVGGPRQAEFPDLAGWARSQLEGERTDPPPTAGQVLRRPIDHGDRLAGLLVSATGHRQRFSAGDLEAFDRIAEQAGAALASAITVDERRRIGRSLQTSLLPDRLPTVAGLRFSRHYLPAGREPHAGGDWYDVTVRRDGRVVLSIGDIVGHGVAAARQMGTLRLALAGALRHGASLAEVLRLARELCRDEGAMATYLLAEIDPVAGVVRCASAGHHAPILARAGSAAPLPLATAPMLGIEIDAGDPPVLVAAFEPGDVVLLFTDGQVEVPGELIDLGIARLCRAVEAELDGRLDTLCPRVHRRMGTGARDDSAMVCAQRLAPA